MASVSIDTRVTSETHVPEKKVCLRSKYKFNNYIVVFTVKEDKDAPPGGLGSGTLNAGVATVLAPRDQMNALLAYNVGDSVRVTFDYSAPFMDNVQFS